MDSSGNAYLTGSTSSSDFPIVNQIPGACQGSCPAPWVAYVTKINAAGSALVYSSFIGGSGGDLAQGIAVDSSGNAYVTGWTESSDFPRVNQIPGTCQGSCGTGNNYDVFVSKINATGSTLLYSSYIGGSGNELAYGVAADGFGNAYVTGTTLSSDFPIVNQVPGACQGTCGTGSEVAFVTEIKAGGSVLVYSSYIGGSGGDTATGVAVDGFGNAYVTGITVSSDFPIVNQISGACQGSCGTGNRDDVFVTKIVNGFFNNLGPAGNLYQCGTIGWVVSGSAAPPGTFTQANEFQSANSGGVSQIDVGVTYVSGVNSFYVSLWTVNAGLPATELARWNNLSTGNCGGLVSITGITGLSLTGGQSYFLVLGPENINSTTFELWNLNSTHVMGSALSSTDGGNTWINNGQQILGAFDIL